MGARYHACKLILIPALGFHVFVAAHAGGLSHVEISGAGGVNWLNTANTQIGISSVETDSVRVNSTSADGAWKAGLGYFLLEDHLLVELNVYGVSSTVKGEVWQYQLPQFNNYRFSAPLSSTRLMLDFKPRPITWNQLTPYLILGAGASWNAASYDEKANNGIDPAGERSLAKHTQTQWAWDIGVGFDYAFTDRISLTTEYIYAFLGDAMPQEGSAIIAAPEFSYQVQSLLFGLSLKI